jgi:predicted transcriptional regulator
MNGALNIDVFHLLYAKGFPMPKKLIEIAAEIVQAQVCLTSMTATDIASSLRQVFSTLHELQKAEAEGIGLASTGEVAGEAPSEEKSVLSPANSIQNDKVICLECGAEMRQLTSKHLVSHGMNQKEYRKKYGFSMRTPLAAKSLTKARSKAAKKIGLPDKLRQYQEARRQKKAAASIQGTRETATASKPKRTRLRKKKAAV